MRYLDEGTSSGVPIDRFTVFFLLFCAASYIHHLLQAYVWFPQPTGQVYILAVIAGFFFPNNFYFFTLLVAAGAMKLFLGLPHLPGHLVFECLLLWAVAAVIVFSFLSRGKNPFDKELTFRRIAPVVRSYMVIMYIFMFLARLDAGFLDPRYSGAVDMFKDIVVTSPWTDWISPGTWVEEMAIWGTIIVELLLPVLLVLPKTRHAGVILGLAFHFLMGLVLEETISNFSAMSYVLLSFFIDDRAMGEAGEILGKVHDFFEKYRFNRVLWKVAAAVLLYALLYFKYKGLLEPSFTFGVWFAFTGLVASLYLTAMFLAHRAA